MLAEFGGFFGTLDDHFVVNGGNDACGFRQALADEHQRMLHAIGSAALDRRVDQCREPFPVAGVVGNESATTGAGANLTGFGLRMLVALTVPLAKSRVGAKERMADLMGLILVERDAVGGGGVLHQSRCRLAVEKSEVAVALHAYFAVAADQDRP